MKAIDLTGKKFGRLTLLKRAGHNRHKHILWLCRCDCGKEKTILGINLRLRNTKSCGCLRGESAASRRRLSPGVASMRGVIGRYKRQGLEFELTEEQFFKLTQKDCHYCGSKPSNIYKPQGNNGGYTYNGLDRVDNTKGYVIGNVVSCCQICNSAKSKLTLPEFRDWAKRLCNKMFGGT